MLRKYEDKLYLIKMPFSDKLQYYNRLIFFVKKYEFKSPRYNSESRIPEVFLS